MISNRTITIIGCCMLALLLLRNEIRLDRIENKIDDVIQIKEHIRYTKNDLDCLTRNIYYEAGVENFTGKLAVAHVTVNRLKTGYWGQNLCRVVYAPLQFSWTLSKKLPAPNPAVWKESESAARAVLEEGYRVRGLARSLYYHAIYIKDPKWADPKHEVGQIGEHVFYNQARGSWVSI